MPRAIRIILITLLTASLALLYPNNLNTLYGLVLVSATAFLTLSISQNRANYLKMVLQILALLLFSGLILIKLTGIYYGITWPDIIILSLTVALMWVLLHTAEMTYSLFWELTALVATLLIAALWLYLYGNPIQPAVIGKTLAERQFNHIVQAIGSANQKQVKQELEARFGLYNSDTWKNGLGSTVPATGPWPLNVFFREFNDSGNALARGLWDKQADELPIADTMESLQSLLSCRIAIRNLLLSTPTTAIYTPFFQAEDFAGSSNPTGALEEKIYAWTRDSINQGAIKSLRGCDIKPAPSEQLIDWIKACIEPIGGGFADDQYLQRIKTFAQACGTVQFVGK